MPENGRFMTLADLQAAQQLVRVYSFPFPAFEPFL